MDHSTHDIFPQASSRVTPPVLKILHVNYLFPTSHHFHAQNRSALLPKKKKKKVISYFSRGRSLIWYLYPTWQLLWNLNACTICGDMSNASRALAYCKHITQLHYFMYILLNVITASALCSLWASVVPWIHFSKIILPISHGGYKPLFKTKEWNKDHMWRC